MAYETYSRYLDLEEAGREKRKGAPLDVHERMQAAVAAAEAADYLAKHKYNAHGDCNHGEGLCYLAAGAPGV